MKHIGVIAVVQPIFINTDYSWVEDRLGQKTSICLYFKTLLNEGIKLLDRQIVQ